MLRNSIATLQDEAKILQASCTTLQAENQLHKQIHIDQNKLIMSEQEERIE